MKVKHANQIIYFSKTDEQKHTFKEWRWPFVFIFRYRIDNNIYYKHLWERVQGTVSGQRDRLDANMEIINVEKLMLDREVHVCADILGQWPK